jgi:hypothetical protein
VPAVPEDEDHADDGDKIKKKKRKMAEEEKAKNNRRGPRKRTITSMLEALKKTREEKAR